MAELHAISSSGLAEGYGCLIEASSSRPMANEITIVAAFFLFFFSFLFLF